MSVLFTESFMRYQRRAAVEASETNDDLVAGGLDLVTYYSTNASPPASQNSNYPSLAIAADPIYAARNCMTYQSVATGSGSRAVRVGMPFAASTDHYIFGVRMRLSRSATNGNVFFFIGPAGISKLLSSITNETGASPPNPWEALLRVNGSTGLVETGISNAYVATSYTYVEGSDIFIEAEVDTTSNLVRVWIDDLLIVDGIFDAAILAAAKAAYDAGFGMMLSRVHNSTSASNPDTAIRDIYCLAVDAVAPFQRLGPTTQVIGELPSDDVVVDFARPSGYASNAEVAALPVVPNPADYLTADQIGQADVYSVTGSTVAAAASQVYAVGVKTQVANFAAAAHTVGAVVRSGAVPTTGTESLGVVSPGVGFQNRAAYFTENPDTAAAWTPQEAADAEFGLTVLS